MKPQQEALFKALHVRSVPKVMEAVNDILDDLGYRRWDSASLERFAQHVVKADGVLKVREQGEVPGLPFAKSTDADLLIKIVLDPVRFKVRWGKKVRINSRRYGCYASLGAWNMLGRRPLHDKLMEKGYDTRLYDLRTMRPLDPRTNLVSWVIERDTPGLPLILRRILQTALVLVLSAALALLAIQGDGNGFALTWIGAAVARMLLDPWHRRFMSLMTVLTGLFLGMTLGGWWWGFCVLPVLYGLLRRLRPS
jgi:hypothetical protein